MTDGSGRLTLIAGNRPIGALQRGPRSSTAATSFAWLALALASASCAPRNGSKPVNRPPASERPSPPSAAGVPNVTNPSLAPCVLELGADREATRDEVLGLLLPAFRVGNDQLPVQHPQPTSDRPDVGGVFLVQPCRGTALESLSPPMIGELQRVALGDGRELVQLPVGTQQGLDEYTVGLLAILGREGRALRVLSISEIASDVPGRLTPLRRARVGSEELWLRSEATSPAAEDSERGNYVSVARVEGNQLRTLGIIWERRESDATFWQGAFAWQMTSPGVEPTATGYVVHEHWTFTQRKTHRSFSRELRRVYTIVDHHLVADPVDDLDAWPQTRR